MRRNITRLLNLTTLIFASVPLLAYALPNVTVVDIGHGTCSGFPSFPHAGDNSDAIVFHPDQSSATQINGLATSIWGNSLVAFDNSTDIANTIFCCVRGVVLDGFGVRSLLLSTASNYTMLEFTEDGVKPETYAHEIDGVRQDGVFLGYANVTTWGFQRSSTNPDQYVVRLLLPGTHSSGGKAMFDIEYKGFLKAVHP